MPDDGSPSGDEPNPSEDCRPAGDDGGGPDSRGGGSLPRCSATGCDADAEFWWYDREERTWIGVCHRDAVTRHPSLEIKAWLESGYMKPVALERPTGEPPEPRTGRSAAFRVEVEKAMDWTDP